MNRGEERTRQCRCSAESKVSAASRQRSRIIENRWREVNRCSRSIKSRSRGSHCCSGQTTRRPRREQFSQFLQCRVQRSCGFVGFDRNIRHSFFLAFLSMTSLHRSTAQHEKPRTNENKLSLLKGKRGTSAGNCVESFSVSGASFEMIDELISSRSI